MTEKAPAKAKKETAAKKDAAKAVASCKDGDVACVHYTGSLETGEVFDSSKDRAPLEFVVGSGQLIKGFDTAVIGMKKGDKKKVLLNPDDAYGDRDDKRMQTVPRDMLPKEPEPQTGMMLTIRTPTGQMFPAKIEKVEGKMVTIDFNHPLAGKKLNFEIELVDIKKNKPHAAHDEGCGCCGH
ncbi:peptidylprolyl isomerase [Candidatus Woesearchaeota archaeon]|nr:peptidylprolyl isomerase [Candidatus Woesearchaeota archaeon]